MAVIQPKKPNLFKRILFSPGMVVTLLVAVVLVAIGLFSLIGKSRQAAKDRRISESQAAILKSQETQFSKKLSALQTDEGQEAALREQFPVVSPGEHVIVIVDSAKNQQAPVEPQPVPPHNFWSFFKGLFTKSDK